MLILDKFRLNNTISFELKVPSILPQDNHHVTVKSVISAEIALALGHDVYAQHAQIYRLLPEGTVEDNAASYSYLLLEMPNGAERRVIGLPWIDDSSIRVHDQIIATFTVTDIAQEDINKIRDIIARYGYHCTVTTK